MDMHVYVCTDGHARVSTSHLLLSHSSGGYQSWEEWPVGRLFVLQRLLLVGRVSKRGGVEGKAYLWGNTQLWQCVVVVEGRAWATEQLPPCTTWAMLTVGVCEGRSHHGQQRTYKGSAGGQGEGLHEVGSACTLLGSVGGWGEGTCWIGNSLSSLLQEEIARKTGLELQYIQSMYDVSSGTQHAI
jgi:hypothetical protein